MVGTLIPAVLIIKRDERERTERQQDLRRAQARLVSLSEPEFGGGSSGYSAGGEHWVSLWRGTVQNSSTETVNSARLRWWLPDHPDIAVDDPVRVLGRLLPGTTFNYVLQKMTEDSRVRDVIAQSSTRAVVELLFTDAAGVRWWRDADHTLHEVAGNDPW